MRGVAEWYPDALTCIPVTFSAKCYKEYNELNGYYHTYLDIYDIQPDTENVDNWISTQDNKEELKESFKKWLNNLDTINWDV